MNQRQQAISTLSDWIGRRKLIWFGTRGDDVESATEIRQLTASFSIISAAPTGSRFQSEALEDHLGHRVDLDAYDIDLHLDQDEIRDFRTEILKATRGDCVMFTYRPSTFLSGINFARSDRLEYLGMFKDHQDAFEHKPWIESELRKLGLPGIAWHYVADEEQVKAIEDLHGGALLLRQSHSSGGLGFRMVESAQELLDKWPSQPEGYVAAAEFLEGTIPVNVGAVVWENAEVTMHPASVQLIGIPSCTNQQFGYCGNDFGAVRDLDPTDLPRIEASTREIGRWLHARGYRGAFGVDFLIHEGTPLFTEVNPRFQGSTHLSSFLSTQLDLPCILVDHLSACLGLEPPPMPSLADYARELPAMGHAVMHNRHPDPVRTDPTRFHLEGEGVRRIDVLPPAGMPVHPGAALARVTISGRLTDRGDSLRSDWAERLEIMVTSALLP